MHYQKAREYVLKRLENELPKNLYYHGIHHTLDVCQAVEELASGEHVKEKDLVLLRTAAVYHDIGFIVQYHNNEEVACQIASETLPGFNYLTNDIKIICHIILATRVPQNPQTHLEQIMCDADLDYLGRSDFFDITQTLKQEWMEFGIISSDEEWNQKQVYFFQQHHYFTKTAQEKREARKHKHLLELQKLL
ncbi:HD domain-containing protein [Rhodocytophaga rosea]|uniref:HD domain-containing protein n=1 Tax=Rhodocytophaga rosea TaxID=2704465 RepID=A0A6C0GQ61_9BACT|nr:HD domain-containing protein [Rhodocytophaga rosea]QHT69753.1 HD domain-containing protein [Rhodocytophaga rosea]